MSSSTAAASSSTASSKGQSTSSSAQTGKTAQGQNVRRIDITNKTEWDKELKTRMDQADSDVKKAEKHYLIFKIVFAVTLIASTALAILGIVLVAKGFVPFPSVKAALLLRGGPLLIMLSSLIIGVFVEPRIGPRNLHTKKAIADQLKEINTDRDTQEFKKYLQDKYAEKKQFSFEELSTAWQYWKTHENLNKGEKEVMGRLALIATAA